MKLFFRDNLKKIKYNMLQLYNMSYYTIPTNQLIYQPESLVNTNLQQSSNIKSNWEYRQYLQKNANDIMKYNTYQAIYTSGNNPYISSNNEEVEKTPFMYYSTYDNRTSKVSHPNTDLRQSYLEKEQFKSRMISPSIPASMWKI
jgi:hypothetical protein